MFECPSRKLAYYGCLNRGTLLYKFKMRVRCAVERETRELCFQLCPLQNFLWHFILTTLTHWSGMTENVNSF